ncbi:MAG: hypothetical protein V7K92_08520 [Nostoc sp.]
MSQRSLEEPPLRQQWVSTPLASLGETPSEASGSPSATGLPEGLTARRSHLLFQDITSLKTRSRRSHTVT